MRKSAFCICENKGANQLSSNHATDQYLCFCYIDSTIPLHSKFKPLTIFYVCTAWFVLQLFGNAKDRFSCGAAPIRQVNIQGKGGLVVFFIII